MPYRAAAQDVRELNVRATNIQRKATSMAAKQSGAGGGNRTRDSCLEGKGITIMQRPRSIFLSTDRAARVPLGDARLLAMWAGQDLNLRIAFASRVYSPVPLTTRPPTHDGDPL